MLRLPTLSSVRTNPPANRNGLLELRARTATHNETRRRPVVATRRKLKYYRKLCVQWIPHNLAEIQNLHRIDWCCEMMRRFASDDSNARFTITIPKPKDCPLIGCLVSKSGLPKKNEVEDAEKRWWPLSSERQIIKQQLL
ncbi:hypothetical protein EVAR_42445_1 [Eumeta japonica]|uniref:Uncharacterized protein n=1 Tax=Eumeta variegata TaxID=151549 RepID=A0A4C1Y0J5_EUMVA|nr:hypothetical protein EVAR_42445_1 [Eumeta japonica]